MRGECTPLRKRFACRVHGSVDVSGRTLGHGGELLSVRWIKRLEILPRGRSVPRSVDEVPETVVVALQPRLRFFRIFRSGSVLHRHKFFGNTHAGRLDSFFLPQPHLATTQLDDDTPPNSVRSHSVQAAARYLPATHLHQIEKAAAASTTPPALLSSWRASRSTVLPYECRRPP